MPEGVLNGPYAELAKEALVGMAEAMHVALLGSLTLESKKDKSSVGYYGFELERQYVRRADNGSEMTIADVAVSGALGKRLLEKFPDIPVLSDTFPEVVAADEGFSTRIAQFLSDFGIAPGTTREDAVKYLRHMASIDAPEGEEYQFPKRFWAFNPMDTVDEFRNCKQYCSTLTLFEDNEPVLAFMGCPGMAFDHPSRTTEHRKGAHLFFAAKGHGSWTELVVIERNLGVYQGSYTLKGKPLKLNVKDKIQRGNEGFTGILDVGSRQLRIATGARLRQDVVADVERVARALGSQYPRYAFMNSSAKYAGLARGTEDSVWSFKNGLYDKTPIERLANHAAGYLIAAEAGAQVADCDGKPLEWCGRILQRNVGVVATDPNLVPVQGLLKVLKEEIETSQKEYEDRCEKRRETSLMLAKVFQKIGELAETDEEKWGASIVMQRGMEMLKDEEEMMQQAQDAINRDVPIMGEAAMPENPFSGEPFTPKT